MNDERLKELLRAALPPSAGDVPSNDVWPQISSRFEERTRWSYVDLGLAAAAATALAVFPEWLWPLAYHL